MMRLLWVPVILLAYLAVGWVFAYALTVGAVNGSKKCIRCGRDPDHRHWNCTCVVCQQRAYLCPQHDTEVQAWYVLAWPGALVLVLIDMTSHFTKKFWRKYNPGVVVEKQIEKKRMTILVNADKEEEDG